MADPNTYSNCFMIGLTTLVAMLTLYPILLPQKNNPEWLRIVFVIISVVFAALAVDLYLRGLSVFFGTG